MSTISALGIGSGLDLNGLLDQLDAAEREKLVPIINRKNSFETKISAFGRLRSSLDAFQSATDDLKNATLFRSAKSSVTGTALTAAAAAGAQSGTYEVNVTQLARAYSIATEGVADRDANLGAGTVEIVMANGDTLSVDLTAGESSLENLKDAINDLDAGVTASIVNDGSDTPYRLTLRSAVTGEDAAIASVDFGDLATSLALDAATEVTALNATFTANGVDIVSQTNQVEGAIENVTLSLAEVGEATVSVSTDTEQIKEKITDFVEAYNSLQETIGKLTAFDQETGEAGDLLGDATMRSARSRLRSVFVEGVANGSLALLSDIGITLQLDGSLEVDSDALDGVLDTDREALEGFFAGNDAGEGLADKLSMTLDGILSDSGLIESAKKGLERRIESLDDSFDRTQLTIERTIERYREQFTQLDIMVANMNQTSGYIAQQFDILNSQLSQARR